MTMKIDAAMCTACGDCEPECPTASIVTKKGVTKITASSCTECDGEYDKPQCVKVCPIKGCIVKV
jgi:Fe-S-cluster-containing hydrogenase component 2